MHSLMIGRYTYVTYVNENNLYVISEPDKCWIMSISYFSNAIYKVMDIWLIIENLRKQVFQCPVQVFYDL